MAEAPDNVVRVAKALARLGLDDAVFVGGAVIPLLLTDAGAVVPRVTFDVDVVVDSRSRVEYYRLEERLREGGYSQPIGGPICRWTIDDVPVDLMPVEIGILGFTNRWYRELVRAARSFTIAPGLTIRLADPALLLATKLEAYLNRGGGDFVMSHDVTDVATLVEGRPEIVDEVRRLDAQARQFVRLLLSELLAEEDVRFAIHGHLPPASAAGSDRGVPTTAPSTRSPRPEDDPALMRASGHAASGIVAHAQRPPQAGEGATDTDRSRRTPMFTRILVPTDFSPSAEAALALVRERFPDAACRLLHVLDPKRIADPLAGAAPARTEREALAGELTARLDEVARDGDERVVEVGAPVEVILAEAEAWRADLIVMGTHGRTGLAHFLNGSVAERVVRRARRPVLIAHQPSD